MAAVLVALGSLMGVRFGGVLTEGRSMRERVWAQKAHAYASVFEALDGMSHLLARTLDEMLRRDRRYRVNGRPRCHLKRGLPHQRISAGPIPQ